MGFFSDMASLAVDIFSPVPADSADDALGGESLYDDSSEAQMMCLSCGGTGYVDQDELCPECLGTGFIHT